MSTSHASKKDVAILARIFVNGDGQIPPEYARHLLDLQVSDADKDRMHELLVRNQEDALSADEKEEMFAFAKATSLLGILKSKVRRTLGVKLKHAPCPDTTHGSGTNAARLAADERSL
jgi:hypothetical protein